VLSEALSDALGQPRGFCEAGKKLKGFLKQAPGRVDGFLKAAIKRRQAFACRRSTDGLPSKGHLLSGKPV